MNAQTYNTNNSAGAERTWAEHCSGPSSDDMKGE